MPMELQASLIAALIGTVFMTLSSTTEMHIEGRQESTAPGRGAAFFIKKLTGIEIEDRTRAMMVLSTWVHWVYGVAWGVVWWLLIGVADLPLWLTAILFWIIVWGAAALHMPLTGVAPPPWKWGGWKWVLLDWWHHFMYVGGTVVGWVVIERIVKGSI